MRFVKTKLAGAYIVEIEKIEDHRGFFARTWCPRELTELDLDPHLAQGSISFSPNKGTLRGMHFQLPPHAESKIVRCTQGSVYDVIIDLRPNSSSYLQWLGVKLTAKNRKALYIPKGFAHGLQTLQENTEVLYLISEFYAPDYARGVRWNDPKFNIVWPEPVTVISERDGGYEDYDPAMFSSLA